MGCIFFCDLCSDEQNGRMDKFLGVAPPKNWTHTRQNGKVVTICDDCLKKSGIKPINKKKKKK